MSYQGMQGIYHSTFHVLRMATLSRFTFNLLTHRDTKRIEYVFPYTIYDVCPELFSIRHNINI